ncbi:MAG TPA: hypothetical protein VMS18_20140 [Candidatus Binatia bacterium]|nr:hypothetical protein [Candidatus Binatia bacterium]
MNTTGPLTDEQKMVKRMRRSYGSARKRINKALEACTPGSNVYLAHLKALADLDSKEREEEQRLGLAPSNLGAAIKTEFVFISHVGTIPSNRQELEKILSKRLAKDCEDLCYDEDDERIRKELEDQYGTSARSNEDSK